MTGMTGMTGNGMSAWRLRERAEELRLIDFLAVAGGFPADGVSVWEDSYPAPDSHRSPDWPDDDYSPNCYCSPPLFACFHCRRVLERQHQDRRDLKTLWATPADEYNALPRRGFRFEGNLPLAGQHRPDIRLADDELPITLAGLIAKTAYLDPARIVIRRESADIWRIQAVAARRYYEGRLIAERRRL